MSFYTHNQDPQLTNICLVRDTKFWVTKTRFTKL